MMHPSKDRYEISAVPDIDPTDLLERYGALHPELRTRLY